MEKRSPGVATEWPDGQNRELDRNLVAELCSTFRNGVRRLRVEDRIKLSVTQEQWEELTLAIAQVEINDCATYDESTR